jgi:hypothetical protein
VDDIRDGSRVGDIIIRPTLRDGYVKANGATLTASEYPRLVHYAVDNGLTVTAVVYATDCSKYVYDSTADTLVVPNMTGRVLQGGITVKSVEAGLPNISGGIGEIPYIYSLCTGAFVKGDLQGAQHALFGSPGAGSTFQGLIFDASKSNATYGASSTVQPPALQMIPQIKY